MNTRKGLLTGCLLAAAALLGGGFTAWRAHYDLVTLDVENMDVREVVERIERQTRESIVIHKDVRGQVTLDVRHAPLDEVLRQIEEQTESRAWTLYPLYSTEQSFASFEEALRGELNPETHGWSSLTEESLPGDARNLPFVHDEEPARKEFVSLKLQERDLSFAVRAFNTLARTCVVVEDGARASVTLNLDRARIAQGVAELAQQAGRRWRKVHLLRAQTDPSNPPRQFMGRQATAES